MKLGIIFIFRNSCKYIDQQYLIKKLNKAENLEICFVNNCSTDETYQILKSIKDSVNNISLVNIKKLKTDDSAVRAGARFMFNNFDINHIGFVNTKQINHEGFNDLIKDICKNREAILSYNQMIVREQKIRKTLFQKLFSVAGHIKAIKSRNNTPNNNLLIT